MPGARPAGSRSPPRTLAQPALSALAAIVVLGCRVVLDDAENLAAGALLRRVAMAAETYLERGDTATVVVASGGRRWGNVVEADAMARELARRGVPERAIVRERCSLSTRDNARFSAEALGRRGIGHAAVVTCAWHMARATALFSRAGLEVEAVAARGGRAAPLTSRIWRWGIERLLTQV